MTTDIERDCTQLAEKKHKHSRRRTNWTSAAGTRFNQSSSVHRLRTRVRRWTVHLRYRPTSHHTCAQVDSAPYSSSINSTPAVHLRCRNSNKAHHDNDVCSRRSVASFLYSSSYVARRFEHTLIMAQMQSYVILLCLVMSRQGAAALSFIYFHFYTACSADRREILPHAPKHVMFYNPVKNLRACFPKNS